MKRLFCDVCDKQMTSMPDGFMGRNLDMTIGAYHITITVDKGAYATDLCQACLNEVVSFCLLETDPYAQREDDPSISNILDKLRRPVPCVK